MGEDGFYYHTQKIIKNDRIQKRRADLIKKWRDKGCSENKINELIQRRINSKRQYW